MTTLSRRGFLAAAALAAATGCSRTEVGTGAPTGDSDLLAKLRKQGYVRVGFAGEAPYGFKDGNTLAGEAPTLHKEIFTALGVPELRPTLTDFSSLIPGLSADRFDVVSAGMAITPDRCAKVIFSEPEFVSPTALMVRKGNPKQLTDLKSAAADGSTVGVLTAAVEGDYAAAAGVPGAKLKALAKQQDGLDALVAGRIDAFALTSISLRWLAKTNSGADVQVLDPFLPVLHGTKQYSPGGAVFRKDADSLRDAFNTQLKKITADPAHYTSLIGKYGFTRAEVPPASLRTAELCKA